MKTIYKYPLMIADTQTVAMPAGAEILTVQVQAGVPCLWVLVDPGLPAEPRAILTRGTGHPIGAEAVGRYVGTYQVEGRVLVFHVFERPTEASPGA